MIGSDTTHPPQRFTTGTVIERRQTLHGTRWESIPVTVIADDGDTLAVRLDPGTPMTFPTHPLGPHPWSNQTHWQRTTVLQLHRTGDWYSVWRLFGDGRERGWYINFEAPLQRGPDWIETLDYGLDIVIASDGTWEWKDPTDPDAFVRIGRMTPVTRARLHEEAAIVAAALDAGHRWWSEWDDWTPTHDQS